MDLPKRKQNRLRDYDYSQNGAYFVTICTKNRKQILSQITVGDNDSVTSLLTGVGRVVKKYIDKIDGIDKYIIMPDHIHMIIIKEAFGVMWSLTPAEKTISQQIKTFKTLVTKALGTSIFQRTYFDHIIRNNYDYEEIWKYIDENPARWLIKHSAD